MTTVTVDIIDDNALKLLKDLEAMNVIKLHEDVSQTDAKRISSIKSLSGKMTKQSIEEIDRQLADFRAE